MINDLFCWNPWSFVLGPMIWIGFDSSVTTSFDSGNRRRFLEVCGFNVAFWSSRFQPTMDDTNHHVALNCVHMDTLIVVFPTFLLSARLPRFKQMLAGCLRFIYIYINSINPFWRRYPSLEDNIHPLCSNAKCFHWKPLTLLCASNAVTKSGAVGYVIFGFILDLILICFGLSPLPRFQWQMKV